MKLFFRKYFLFLAYLLMLSSCSNVFKTGDFIETKKMESVLKYVNKDTLFIFDIDSTILKLYMTDGGNNKLYVDFDATIRFALSKCLDLYKDQIFKRLNQKQTIEKEQEDNVLKYLKRFLKKNIENKIFDPEKEFYSKVRPELVEPETLDIFKKLQDDGIKTLIFTGRPIKAQQITDKQIRDLGIDPGKTALYDQELNENKYAYKDGILYSKLKVVTDVKKEKGEMLTNFFQKIKFEPNKIIFIDNEKDNVLNVVNSLREKDIKGLGFWYRAFEFPENSYLDDSGIEFYNKIVGTNWWKVDINVDEAVDYILKKINRKKKDLLEAEPAYAQ